LQDADEQTEGLKKELKTAQADREAQVNLALLKAIRKYELFFAITSILLHLTFSFH